MENLSPRWRDSRLGDAAASPFGSSISPEGIYARKIVDYMYLSLDLATYLPDEMMEVADGERMDIRRIMPRMGVDVADRNTSLDQIFQ